MSRRGTAVQRRHEISDSTRPGCPDPPLPSRAFSDLSAGKSMRAIKADCAEDSGAPDRLTIDLDGTEWTLRAGALPVSASPASAALRIEIADDPFHSASADEEHLNEAGAGATITRAEVTGHANSPAPYAVLLVLDNHRQILIEAQSIPATSGAPLITFCAEPAACPNGDAAACDVFDAHGRLAG